MLKNTRLRLLKLTTFIISLCFFIISCKKDKKDSYNNTGALSSNTAYFDQGSESLSKRPDTIYIKNKTLIIVEGNKKYEFRNLIIKASSLYTTLKLETTNNSFYLIYNYFGSFMKRNVILELTWKNNNIYINKKYNILLDSRNNIDFGWVTLYNSILLKENIDYIEDLDTLVNYNIKSEKECDAVIDIFTRKDTIINNYCNKNKITKLPAFYSDASLLGYYEFNDDKNSLFLSFDNTKNLNFIIEDKSIKNIPYLNDIGYYLEQSGAYVEAVALLEKIVKKSPSRTVAYVNLGDAYWELRDKLKAKKAYKTYVEQMKTANKKNKIPERVFNRLEN